MNRYGVGCPDGLKYFFTIHYYLLPKIWWVSPSGLRPRIVVPVFVGSNPITHPNKETRFVYLTNLVSLRDAFLAEHDVHYVCDADFVCDARLRRVKGTHRITYHSVAASLIT